MKTIKLFLILIATFLGIRAQASQLDSETQTKVIERLDRIISLMEKKDSSWVPSNIRLADLLAERARLRFMNEVEANCRGCKGSVSDRKRALKIYESVLQASSQEMRGNIYFQMGHLYQIAGQSKKAASLFENVLKSPKKYNPKTVRRARTSLADLEFERGNYKEAMKHYQIALKQPETPNRGLILYRKAWCEFNLQKLSAGIRTLETLSSSPQLLVKETENGPVADPGFQSDVLRDLATFYSRQKVSSKEIQRFQSLVPNNQRKEILFFFANEISRVGQKRAASQVYQEYLKTPGLTKEEQLEVMVLLAQTEYDKDGSSQSIESFAKAAQAYRNISCDKDAKCLELQKQMKHYVTELHRSKKINPDHNTLKAYEIFVQTFPQDTEMSMRGAVVADQINKPEASARLFHHSAETAVTTEQREISLLGEISAAEKTHDPALRESAYNHYLKLNPKGEKSFEVRYQLAHLAYEKKNYSSASEQFKVLALEKSGSSALRKSSADLALDSLAVLKKDLEIEKWALEFAAAFPQDRSEFERISRKAVMNQVVQTTNNKKSSTRELEQALEKLHQTRLNTATQTEKILHYKNMLLLAERVDSEKSLLVAVNGLLGIKALHARDREDALARAVGFYERRLQFKSAYSYAVRMKFPGLRKSERELRLGTLADLAGLNPRHHYQNALKSGLSKIASHSVRQRLVLISKNPSRELLKHRQQLLGSPAILNETILTIYSRDGLTKDLRSTVHSRKYAHLSSVRFIQKQSFYKTHARLDRKISAHSLNLKSDRQMAKTIKSRLRLLKSADQSLAEALRIRDVTSQIMALTTIARENHRLAMELSKSPMPKGLTEAEQKKYVQLLNQQTRPYVVKAQMAQGKLESLWSKERFFIDLISDYERSRHEIQKLLQSEIRTLAALSPNANLRNRLNSALREDQPSPKELMAAREDVRENPENLKRIEKLKNLETKIGHPLMSPYLQGRLEQIQKETVL